MSGYGRVSILVIHSRLRFHATSAGACWAEPWRWVGLAWRGSESARADGFRPGHQGGNGGRQGAAPWRAHGLLRGCGRFARRGIEVREPSPPKEEPAPSFWPAAGTERRISTPGSADPETFAGPVRRRREKEGQATSCRRMPKRRLTYNGNVIRMYSKSRLEKIFAERSKSPFRSPEASRQVAADGRFAERGRLRLVDCPRRGDDSRRADPDGKRAASAPSTVSFRTAS